jgi:hypothetical protein
MISILKIIILFFISMKTMSLFKFALHYYV